jgi:putative ABC transport system permease protein
MRGLLRGRGSNVIKIISLTLGLFGGMLLFAKVASLLSWNTGYANYKELYVIRHTIYMANGERSEGEGCVSPLAPALYTAFPEEIESATAIFGAGSTQLIQAAGKNWEEVSAVSVDTSFFRTMGISVLQGRVSDLSAPENAFVSDRFARRVYGNETAIGKEIKIDDDTFIIRGLFKAPPENNNICPDVTYSAEKLWQDTEVLNQIAGWNSRSILWNGYIRLRKGVDVRTINDRIDELVESYTEFNPKEHNFGVRYYLAGVQESFTTDNKQGVVTQITGMSALGIGLLLIAAFNYVLLSIASLTRRAKTVGVHKCNGATDKHILYMFLIETTIHTLIAVLLAGILIFSLQTTIEEVLDTGISTLFSGTALWGAFLTIIAIFFIAAVLPARIFSLIPVTQVFRRSATNHVRWKQPLLFIEFASIGLICGCLFTLALILHRIHTYDFGFQPQALVSAAGVRMTESDAAMTTIRSLAIVENAARRDRYSVTGSQADVYGEDGNVLFKVNAQRCDVNYPVTIGVTLLQGRYPQAIGEILVDEYFVRRMGWDNPLGRQVRSQANRDGGTVVGVIRHISTESLLSGEERLPEMLILHDTNMFYLTIRLKPPYAENIAALDREFQSVISDSAMKELFASRLFIPQMNTFERYYSPIRRFRDMSLIAFFAILLIAFTGLVGYINDEMRRRTKEIALRKVHGADAAGILRLLSADVLRIAIPAVVIGLAIAFFISDQLLQTYPYIDVKLSVISFAAITFGILGTIVATVCLKAWRVANGNPVDSLKAE